MASGVVAAATEGSGAGTVMGTGTVMVGCNTRAALGCWGCCWWWWVWVVLERARVGWLCTGSCGRSAAGAAARVAASRDEAALGSGGGGSFCSCASL